MQNHLALSLFTVPSPLKFIRKLQYFAFSLQLMIYSITPINTFLM